MNVIIGFCTFLSILFIYFGYRSTRNHQIQQLKKSFDGRFAVEEQRVKKQFNMPFLQMMFSEFQRAGFRLGFIEFLLLVILTAIAGYIFFSSLVSPGYGWAGAVIGVISFRIWIRGRVKKRRLLLRAQFGSALVRMANALRAHVPIEESIRMVAEKIPDPLRSEFVLVYQYYQVENNIIKALKQVQEHIPLEEFRLFVISAEINQEIGGDFAELMEKLSTTISDKAEMEKKMNAYSVQGKNNATTIGILPIFTFAFFRFFVPDFIDPLISTEIGRLILFYCFSSILFGWWFVRRMVDVDID